MVSMKSMEREKQTASMQKAHLARRMHEEQRKREIRAQFLKTIEKHDQYVLVNKQLDKQCED